MQSGRIYRKGRAWILSYGVKVHEPDGGLSWARRSKKLAAYGDDFRTAASVRHLAAEILAPLNAKTARPESTDTVEHFLENVYLPHCKANLRPSTQCGLCLAPEPTQTVLKDLPDTRLRSRGRRTPADRLRYGQAPGTDHAQEREGLSVRSVPLCR